ncbi:MAG: DUF4824 family protein [Bryobacterales bacterium]|nr:DUF4824 family protein [Bryobacterales bacterium]
MRRLNGLHIAVLVVLAANALALRHAAANRQGAPEADIELTDRELVYHSGGDNAPVFLRLEYSGSAPRGHVHDIGDAGNWITVEELSAAGFDCTIPVKDPRAAEHYQKQQVRPVIAAFEYRPGDDAEPRSHLVAAGIGRDLPSMRRRFPDRSKVILLPASVRIYRGKDRPQAWLTSVPVMIHVPHEYQAGFRNLPTKMRAATDARPLYRVRLRYGANLEPWIAAVDFPQGAK